MPSETLQLNMEFPPALMLFGSAIKKLITGMEDGGGGGGGVPATVTVTDWLLLPAALVAMRI